MMFLLSPNDIQRLSPACRAELMTLIMSSDTEALEADDRLGSGGMDVVTPTADEVLEEKRVVDLSIDEAKDLLANISDRSQETLKLFASGKSVALSSLIGTGGEYRDYSELKRSFVGAVNRRLRTVSGNRNAALFSSDRDKTRIKVTKKAALALRAVFKMPDPVPEFAFIDRSGKHLDASEPQCQELETRLALAWEALPGRSSDLQATSWSAQVLTHFANSGFALFVGTPTNWDEAAQSPIYEIQTVADPLVVIANRLDDESPRSLDEVFIGLGSDAQLLARPNC